MQLEYPSVILNIDQIKALYDMEEIVGKKIETFLDNLDKDININSSTEYGISRRENILGIKPLSTDTLEDRRFRVAAKWNDTYPYTLQNLKKRLDELVGKGNYSLEIDNAIPKMTARIALDRKEMYTAVYEMIEKIVPLNIVLDINLMYNTHSDLSRYTHEQLSTMTHMQIKEEVM